jgi:Ni/Fe-hydrogenase subunit HybB-like protein
MSTIRTFSRFFAGSIRLVTRGNGLYWAWIALLLTVIGFGAAAYLRQLDDGLITTSLRDQVSWGFYIGNFTFLVGVAAAAVMLVVPAYLYHWKPIKEIVVFGELLAVSAITVCALFVMVDIGHPERFWHLIPGVGHLNVPSSMLGWDVIALNSYLVLNFVIVTYVLFTMFSRKEPNKRFFMPLVWLSIPAAVGIHTVTAFLYNGLIARPYWNAAILAPRFIASAFCSGPAVLLILMQLLRRFTKFEIRDEAIWKIAELMAYFMAFNLFLLGAEVFKEYYSDTHHLIHMQYMFSGVDGHKAIVPWMWTAVSCSIAAFLLFLLPRTRQNWVTLNLGCVLIFLGVYLEKGMGLVIPGMTPDTLGEIYEYVPSSNELTLAMGVLAVGALIFTLMVKVATPILLGDFHVGSRDAGAES